MYSRVGARIVVDDNQPPALLHFRACDTILLSYYIDIIEKSSNACRRLFSGHKSLLTQQGGNYV